MAAASLEPALAQAAGDRGVLAQRDRRPPDRRRHRDRAGDPGPDPRVGHRHRHRRPGHHSSSGTSRSSAGWAVTLTPAGSGWLVWDIEPAGAGNS